MKRCLLSVLVLLSLISARSQTWAEQVAPILFSNCASCHRPGGIAPFSLLTYSDAYSFRASISAAVSSRHMPPWPPDDTYVHFAGARVLTQAQINTIVSWVNAGAPSGNLANAPPPPPPQTNSLGTPDTVLKIPVFTSTATTSDLYRCFVLPLRLPTGKFLSAAEVVPGNASIVHHVLLYQDTTANHAALQLDNASPGPGYTNFGGIGVNSAILLDAWVPGTTVRKMPVQFGKRMYPNSDLVIQIHYPAGSNGRVDSTSVRLYYSSNPAARDVRVEPILHHFAPVLVNGPLNIPANTVRTFEERFTLPIPYKASVLAVAPHMHLIGESIYSFANKPTGDTIRFIRVPHWDFHWQGQYYYQRPVVVETGSVLRAFATYNNTASNPHNPSSPPRNVGLGESTTDEMMLVYFAFTAYQAGDENLLLDSSLLTTGTGDPRPLVSDLTIFPNPATVDLRFHNPRPHEPGRMTVWNMGGQKQLDRPVQHEFVIRVPVRNWPAGVYTVFIRYADRTYSGKVVVRKE